MSIVTESTSVIQVDSSGLQNGGVNVVYVSTTTIPGQLVSVIDATGFTSSPQAILLSTVGGATFTDGTTSTSIRQQFGYVTLVSQNNTDWSIVNRSAFSNATISSFYKSLDAGTVDTYLTEARGLLSTGSGISRRVTTSSMTGAIVYGSTLYINSISSFMATRPNDYGTTLIGNEYVTGSLVGTGSASYRGVISTGGDLFVARNTSSKSGVISVTGDVTVGGTLRAQRGVQAILGYLSTFTTSGYVGPVTIQSSASAQNVTARTISTQATSSITINVQSSIIFRGANQSLVNRPDGLTFLGLSVTVPSSVRTNQVVSQSLATSNLILQNFGQTPLSFLTLGSTVISNANGSLVTSSIRGISLVTGGLVSPAVENTSLLTHSIALNDAPPSGNISIPFGGNVYDISGYWMISSVGTQGTLNAPYVTLSTLTMLARSGTAQELNTQQDTVGSFTVGSVDVHTNVTINGLSTLSLKNVFINNSSGSITGSATETIHDIHCSSLITDELYTGTADMRFLTPVDGIMQNTFISTLASQDITTSSLSFRHVNAGMAASYSTLTPSSPWLLASTFNMNTGPFMMTKGLGTYIEPTTFVASQDETTYYSIINPLAQQNVYLSTPYINTIAGTGVSGPIQNGRAVRSPLGSALSQPAIAEENIFVGSKDLGWKIQQIGPDGTISTTAGNYRYFYGDGMFPLNAAFSPQLAVSVSPVGQVVITDISNVRIRVLTQDPLVGTIAGTGASSYSGDGGLAYLATFSTPRETATDSLGNIYVADSLNRVIRKISGSTISTYAGIPGVAGSGGDGGPALAATFSDPYGLTIDTNRRLYVTDMSNCVIRQITPAGGISLVAGSYTNGYTGDGGPATSATLSYPRGIVVDPLSNIYVCDAGNNVVRKINAITQTIETIAGNGVGAYSGDGGLAVAASLSTPTGIAIDTAGNLYIADTNNQCVRYVNMTSQRITTVAGIPRVAGYAGDYSFATFARLNFPSHLALDRNNGYLYIADDGNARIRYVDPSMGIIYPVAGNGSPMSWGDGGPAAYAVFGGISCVARDGADGLYIVDDMAHMVRKINLSTQTIEAVAGTVAGFGGDGGPAVLAALSTPQQLVIGSNGSLYLTDRDNQRIRSIQGGIISTVAGTGIAGYAGDGGPATAAQLNTPTALAIDLSDSLYVADLGNSRIRAITSGQISTYAGNGIYGVPVAGTVFLNTPLASTTAMAFDTAGLCFTDISTNAIWRLTTATQRVEALNVVTGGGYLGDAGPLSNAYLSTPTGLISDGAGNLILSDQGNSRLRRTYTFGFPQTPVYLTMNFGYTNYFTSTGTATISLNGNVLKTFSGSNQSNDTFDITNTDIFMYPLQGVNPVSQDQIPYVQITQSDSTGYTKLLGSLYVQALPSQGMLQDSVNTGAGIYMNSGSLNFPNQTNSMTIDNRYNDASTRSVLYSGQIQSASDPALKTEIVSANLGLCYSTLADLPLKRYRYNEPYVSTFRVQDMYRLGFLTTDVEPLFPISVQPYAFDHSWGPSTIHTLDLAQIRFNHYGVTQQLAHTVSTLEGGIAALVAKRDRLCATQRNTVL